MLEVTGGMKMQWEPHSERCSLAGTVVTGWDSSRETGELGDTWSWEKRWALTCHDPDRLWTGQKVGQYGSGLWSGAAAAPKGNCALGRDLIPAAARSTKREEGGHNLFSLSVPHGLIKGLKNKADYQCQPGTNVQSGHC